MPTYTFKVVKVEKWLAAYNKELQEPVKPEDIVEFDFGIKEYDNWLKEHPGLERYFDTAPSFRFDGRTFGSLRDPTGLPPRAASALSRHNDVMQKIAENHPTTPLGQAFRKNKTIKDVKTQRVLEKHGLVTKN